MKQEQFHISQILSVVTGVLLVHPDTGLAPSDSLFNILEYIMGSNITAFGIPQANVLARKVLTDRIDWVNEVSFPDNLKGTQWQVEQIAWINQLALKYGAWHELDSSFIVDKNF